MSGMSFIVHRSSLIAYRSAFSAGLLLLLAAGCQEPPDEHVPPVVRFLSPANGDTLQAGMFEASAIATDSAGMKRVSFWRDSTILGFDEYPIGDTWSVRVDGRTGFLGSRRLAANAIDQADNQGFDTVRVFFVP